MSQIKKLFGDYSKKKEIIGAFLMIIIIFRKATDVRSKLVSAKIISITDV